MPVTPSANPSPPKKEPRLEPTCKTCKWADLINQTQFVHCTVDLPPFIQKSNDNRKYQVHEAYRCGLWRAK